MVQDRGAAFRNGRITALPVAELTANAGFRAAVALRSTDPVALEPAELVGMLAPPVPHVTAPTPAYLLRADMEAVTFVGRSAELDLLHRWCLEGTSPVALLVGSGWQGKTRLARKLVATMREQGWTAGIVADNAEQLDRLHDRVSVLGGATRPLLLVVDYAETAPVLVTEMLRHVVGHSAVRLLLLARSAGDWWGRVSSSSPAVEMATWSAPVHELTELAGDVDARNAIYWQSLTELAARLGAVPGYGEVDWPSVADGLPSPNLAPAEYGLALHLLTAALSGLLEAAAPSGERPMDVLLAHERRYWRRTAAAGSFALPEDLQEQAVAAATLFGAADRAEARSLALRIPDVGGEARLVDPDIPEKADIVVTLRAEARKAREAGNLFGFGAATLTLHAMNLHFALSSDADAGEFMVELVDYAEREPKVAELLGAMFD